MTQAQREYQAIYTPDDGYVILLRAHDYVWNKRKAFDYDTRLSVCLELWNSVLIIREGFDSVNPELNYEGVDDDDADEVRSN